MMRISRIGFAIRFLAALTLITGPLCLAAHAAPPKPPAAPTGTIYYSSRDATISGSPTVYYAVKPDGTGQAVDILPNFDTVMGSSAKPAYSPSASNATHDRWWITLKVTDFYDEYISPGGSVTNDFPHWDFFAVRSDPQNRSQLITVQLTDLYGMVMITNPHASWSNDGNNDLENSFVTLLRARDIRDAFVVEEDGTTVVNAAGLQDYSLRFPLTSTEIEPGYVPFRPESAEEDAKLDAMFMPVTYPMTGLRYGYGNGAQGKFDPSGSFYLRDTNVAEGKTELSIVEWSTGNTQVLWDGRNGAPTTVYAAQWSPDGQTIAMENRQLGLPSGGAVYTGGDIYTQPATGAAAPKKVLAASVKGPTVITYSQPAWSPDNKYVVVVKTQYNLSTLTGAWITRLSLSDGKTVDLVPISTKWGVFTYPLRWTADN